MPSKKKHISRKDFIVKTSKCVGGIVCIPMAVSIFQSCDKPNPVNSITEETLYISECPCHGAQFDQDGNVIQLPSTADQIESLEQYSTTITETSFTVFDSDGNETALLFSDHEDLQTIGGVSSLSSVDFNSDGLLLYRKSQSEIVALSRNCTHNGCQIENFQEV
jgi:Rieske Fe-S protein